MRLYKISAIRTTDSDLPDSEITYVGTQSDAAAVRKRLTTEGWTRKEVESVEVDVPTDKAGLMAFLNGLVAS